MSEDNGRSVTVRELNDKLKALRWELRCYMALLVLGVLVRSTELPAGAIGFLYHLL